MSVIRDHFVRNKKENLTQYELYPDALTIYNDVTLCETFGWTPQDILEMPYEYYQSALTIMSLRHQKDKEDAEKAEEERKKKETLSRLKTKHGRS